MVQERESPFSICVSSDVFQRAYVTRQLHVRLFCRLVCPDAQAAVAKRPDACSNSRPAVDCVLAHASFYDSATRAEVEDDVFVFLVDVHDRARRYRIADRQASEVCCTVCPAQRHLLIDVIDDAIKHCNSAVD